MKHAVVEQRLLQAAMLAEPTKSQYPAGTGKLQAGCDLCSQGQHVVPAPCVMIAKVLNASQISNAILCISTIKKAPVVIAAPLA